MNIIDPHLHLFNLQDGNYHWLKPENPPQWPDKKKIYRGFDESDLLLKPPTRLAGFVHIEAGFDNEQPWREIDWLEQHCDTPLRTVAAIDLLSAGTESTLDKLAKRQSVVGVRHILDEEAVAILQQPQALKSLKQISSQGYIFEAQLLAMDTPAILALVHLLEGIPELRIVVNHAGFPPLTNGSDRARWSDNMRLLASHPHAMVKLSGWEMSDRQWFESGNDNVRDTISSMLDTFTDKRVMMASNFPLCTFSTSYADLWQRYSELVDVDLHHALFHDNAYRCYGF